MRDDLIEQLLASSLAVRKQGDGYPVLVADLAVADVTLRHDGRALATADRKELLTRVRAGEVIEIEFDAVTFVQRETPNAKYVRIRPGALGRFAKSFKAMPFLSDHAQWRLDARGGTIVSSELISNGGVEELHQTIRAVKPWAVEGLLDGTIDRFSVGFRPAGKVTCSIHGGQVWKDCRCWPGELVDGKPVEFIFSEALGVETSAVNVPAVTGTSIEGIRAALAAHGDGPQEADMDPKLKIALGLAATATDEECLAAVAKLQAEQVGAAAKVALLEGQLATVNEQRAKAAAAELATKVDGEIERAYGAGRIPLQRDEAGKRTPHPVETAARGMVATLGFEAAKAYLDSLPVVAPIGQAAQAAVTSAPARAKVEGDVVAQLAARYGVDVETLRANLARQGITAEQLAANAPALMEV